MLLLPDWRKTLLVVYDDCFEPLLELLGRDVVEEGLPVGVGFPGVAASSLQVELHKAQ